MTARRTTDLRRGALALLAAAVLTACGSGSDLDRVARTLTAVQSGAPFAVPDYVLTDQTGAEVNVREVVEGRFGILFFGYTHCPDVCPISMSVAAAAVAQLEPEQRERVRVLFVTVDPRRDSPERIAEWLAGLRSDAIGLRGSKVQIEGLLRAMGFAIAPSTSVQALPPSTDGSENYLVPHPASLFLITPDGLGRFQYPFDRATPAQIAEDLRKLLDVEWPAPGDGAVAAGAGTGLEVLAARVGESANGETAPVYATIRSRGAADALVGMRMDVDAVATLHEMSHAGGVMAMRATDRIGVPAGGSVELKPGGLHGMLGDAQTLPVVGDTVALVFVFASGAEVRVRAPVVSIAELAGGR